MQLPFDFGKIIRTSYFLPTSEGSSCCKYINIKI